MLFTRADSSIAKTLSYPRIKLSNSQTLILDGVEIGVLLSDLAQQLRKKIADIPDISFTLLDAAETSPTLVFNQNAKTKPRGICVPSKSERQKLQNLYIRGAAVCGSVRNFSKASDPPVSKAGQLLRSKISHPSFTLAIRKFKRMKAFARFEMKLGVLMLLFLIKWQRQIIL